MSRLLLLVPVLLAGIPARASAQVYTRPDSVALARAAAFAELVHWVETSHGTSEHTVYLRSSSSQAIQVVSYEVYDCINIPSRVCKVHQPGPVIQPGKIMRLVTISRRRQESWSYSYRFEVSYLPSPVELVR